MINNSQQQVGRIVREISLAESIHENALPYAYYVINDRALIHTDGLKPVQRRILYTLHTKGVKNDKKLKGTAIGGETMAYYHPHGDKSITDALEHLGKEPIMRVPLVDIQGNVGIFTGSSSASPRYYEAGLSKAGQELVKDIDENTVDFFENFAGKKEPYLLPIRFPVGIINGTSGIAVGYASKMFPHNPNEVMDACVARLKNKINSTKDLMKYMRGPDFPTGGEIVAVEGIEEYLETGKGTFIVRGKFKIEKLSRNRHEICFYELPYQISVEQIITKIKELQSDKNDFTEISEIKNLSDKNKGIYLSIITKSNTNPYKVIQDLFKKTDCESKFPVNSTVLTETNQPEQVGYIALIDQFLNHKTNCFVRKYKYRINQLEKEIEKQKGLLAISKNIDKAIEIIKTSENSDIANQLLQKEFNINAEQAEYILQLPLRTLTKNDKNKIILRNEKMIEEATFYKDILNNKEKTIEYIIKELEDTKKIIKDDRRTTITTLTTEDLKQQTKDIKNLEKQISKDIDCFITIFDNNTLLKTLGNQDGQHKIPIRTILKSSTQSNLFQLDKNGYIKEIKIDSIPLDIISTIENDTICYIENDSFGTLVVTNLGNVNIFRTEDLKDGLLAKLEDGEYIIFAQTIQDKENDLCIINKDGLLAKFSIDNIRDTKQGSGFITGMKSNDCVHATISKKYDTLVTFGTKTIKFSENGDVPTKGRGAKGSLLHKTLADETINKIYSVDLSTMKLTNKKGKDIKIIPINSPRAAKGFEFKENYLIGF